MNLSRRMIREGGVSGRTQTMTQEVALITGGASGIGKSTAMILVRKGINVVISGRREALGEGSRRGR
jgi:NAD(P)-dependent dehydrogenase (short-subunit alcohol dehydrogenase family)